MIVRARRTGTCNRGRVLLAALVCRPSTAATKRAAPGWSSSMSACRDNMSARIGGVGGRAGNRSRARRNPVVRSATLPHVPVGWTNPVTAAIAQRTSPAVSLTVAAGSPSFCSSGRSAWGETGLASTEAAPHACADDADPLGGEARQKRVIPHASRG